MKLAEITQEYLGWQRVVSKLVGYGETSMGRASLERIGLLPGSMEMSRTLARVEEMKNLLGAGEEPVFAGVTDLRELLGRAGKEGVLSAPELLEAGDCLQGLSRLNGYFASNSHRLSANSYLRVRMSDFRFLTSRIEASLERDGRIKDSASSILHDLRGRAASLHQTIREKLDRYTKSHDSQELLQERYYTSREDRYVLPVRAERQGGLEGIVHGVSQTGATVFIEPRFLVADNNRLKLLQEEVRREEYKVLVELTEALADQEKAVEQALEMAGIFDDTCARARLADFMAAHPAQVGEELRLDLVGARSPLLVLHGTKVVPNDIQLGGEFAIIVLSGPNAGGKSVALKTCGLCLLMTWCGLEIPASADSYVPVLAGLHALPGDLEDTEGNLSTFTGHLAALNGIMEVADARHLVLIDELMVGTEPDHGSALGAAYLQELAERGSLAIVATHYERLKALAVADKRFRNGAMGVEGGAMRPTFMLAMGEPGSSRTFAMARRYGVLESIVERAQEIIQGKGGGLLEDALQSLADREHELAVAVRESRHREEEAAALLRRRQLALKSLEQHAEKVVARKVEEAMKDVEEALTQVSGLVAQLQQGKTDQQELVRKRHTLKEIRNRMADQARRLDDDQIARELAPEPSHEFREGGEVLVKKFRKNAVVVTLYPAERMAALKMGPMRLRLPYDELVPLVSKVHKDERSGAVRSDVETELVRRVDLRGMDRDEALSAVMRALDQAMFTAGAELVVVHGHGTGALKQAVRSLLKSTTYPLKYRAGKRGEGGDGVTIVQFD
jgi:DNA mismatch repair protein MutS2